MEENLEKNSGLVEKAAYVQNPIKPEITFEQFEKIDVRLCRILSVEKVEKSDKLYKMIINTGIDERIVVSSIAKVLQKEELIGNLFPFVLNLPPRKIFGIDSTAMILLAENQDELHQMTIIGQDDPFAKQGAIVI